MSDNFPEIQPEATNQETIIPEQPVKKERKPYTKKASFWANRKYVDPETGEEKNLPIGGRHAYTVERTIDKMLDTKEEIEQSRIQLKEAVKKAGSKNDMEILPSIPTIRRKPITYKQEIPDIMAVNLSDLGDELVDYMDKPSVFWLKDFFIYKKIPFSWVKKMLKASPYFAHCYEQALDIMESKLVKLGMKKRNPAFGMFALKQPAVAGWKDVTEVKSEVQINTLSDVIKQAMNDKKKVTVLEAKESKDGDRSLTQAVIEEQKQIKSD